MLKKRTDRRVKRYQVRLPVTRLNGRESHNALVVDVSSLGARLETDAPMPLRQPVDFSVLLPGQEAEIRLSGQVVWMRPLPQQPGRFQLGLQFFGPQWIIDRLGREGKL